MGRGNMSIPLAFVGHHLPDEPGDEDHHDHEQNHGDADGQSNYINCGKEKVFSDISEYVFLIISCS